VNRTNLLTVALSRLTEAVTLLIEAGEQSLAANLEDLVQQIELTLANTPQQAPGGFDAASRSFSEAHARFQILTSEMMEYAKVTFDDALRTWEQLIGVRSIEKALQIQSDYAQRVYQNHMAALFRLAQMGISMMSDASRNKLR
jgi:hypothetical protein